MIHRASKIRWRAILLIVTLAFVALFVAHQWYQREVPLNLILITLDTTRADRLGVYGYQNGCTSGFDRYAQSGVVFERAYAPAPITLPSHATMLTGLYPPEHGLRVNGQGRLSNEIRLLPEILKDNGYATAGFVSAIVLDSTYGLHRGFDLYDDCSSDMAHTKSQRRTGQIVVDNALAWLGGQASRPFFGWIHLFDAHAPYEIREELFGDRFQQNPYDAGIALELQQVERIVSFLKERRLDKNTLVVIAGDHGEGLGEHGESEHGMFVYNATLHVPLIFVGDRHCQSGRRIATAVSLADITPTVLDIMGIDSPRHMSGRSLKAALSGREIPARHCYAEAESPFVLNHWCPLRVVILDRWKYIQSTRPELYNLQEDFAEQRNLVAEFAEEQKELDSVLELIQQSFTFIAPQKLHLSDKEISDLRTLGYVDLPRRNRENGLASTRVLKDVKDMLPLLEKFDRAKELALKGKVEEAIAILRELERMEDSGEFLEAGYLLSDCLAVTNRLDEAIDVLLQILDKHPDAEKTRLRLGSALAKQGRFEQATEEFRTVLQLDPDCASAHLELARLLVRLQKVDDAITEYREATRTAPEASSSHLELGQLFVRLKRHSEAAACFERAIKCDPSNAMAQTSLLGVLVQLGESAKAFELAKSSVKNDPASFEARFNLGILLISQKQYREGIMEFRQAQKLRPDDPRPFQLIQQADAAWKQIGK